MPQAKASTQAQFSPADALHALVDHKLTVSKLAKSMRRPRESVSRAIHHSVFPRLRVKIAQRLGLS